MYVFRLFFHGPFLRTCLEFFNKLAIPANKQLGLLFSSVCSQFFHNPAFLLSIVQMRGPWLHHHKVYLSLYPMFSYAFHTFKWHPLDPLCSQLLPESHNETSGIYGDMAFDSWNFLSGIVAFFTSYPCVFLSFVHLRCKNLSVSYAHLAHDIFQSIFYALFREGLCHSRLLSAVGIDCFPVREVTW